MQPRRRLPADRAARRSAGRARHRRRDRGIGLRPSPRVRPRGRRGARQPAAEAVGPLHRAGSVPRAARHVRVPRRGDFPHRTGHRGDDPAAAPDRGRRAQQTADADLLSHERLRLGVGTGWNYVEYDSLGEDFATRGPRLDEQIGLLRRLWGEPLLTFHGRFDQLERACINPRPRRQIPIWIGGFSEPAYRRGGRLGDGFTFAGDVDAAVEGMDRVRHHLTEAGRSADGFGFELVCTRARSAAEVVEAADRWQAPAAPISACSPSRSAWTRPLPISTTPAR